MSSSTLTSRRPERALSRGLPTSSVATWTRLSASGLRPRITSRESRRESLRGAQGQGEGKAESSRFKRKEAPQVVSILLHSATPEEFFHPCSGDFQQISNADRIEFDSSMRRTIFHLRSACYLRRQSLPAIGPRSSSTRTRLRCHGPRRSCFARAVPARRGGADRLHARVAQFQQGIRPPREQHNMAIAVKRCADYFAGPQKNSTLLR